MGRLTTHVLDTSRGLPAVGLTIDLVHINDHKAEIIKREITNNDGRCDAPLLEGKSLVRGRYQLIFHASDYLRQLGNDLPEYAFLDEVVIAFGLDCVEQHYHVPLLLSAYGYSTYRGS